MGRKAWIAAAATMALIAGAGLAGCDKAAKTVASAQDAHADAASVSMAASTKPYPDEVYWGDTHLHTMDSNDAIMFGTRLSPEDALRFARGEEVTTGTGMKAKLDRPLDFLVVTDHAEGIGTGREIYNGNQAYLADPTIKRWNEMMHGPRSEQEKAALELIKAFTQQKLPAGMTNIANIIKTTTSVWAEHVATVERYNEPGKFTAFEGYEYTSTPKGDNLHRNVIFRDGPDKVGKIIPFSSLASPDPEKLWAFLANYEKTTGGKVIAIPHNSDLSNGLMFALTDVEGKPLTADYAQRRARWEPLTEVTQIKGDSESHPYLSPNDEFADFGHQGWDQGNLDLSQAKTKDMLAGDYAREALKRGLLLQAKLGVNPYKFGMIGATDSHSALSSHGEAHYFAHDGGSEQGEERAGHLQMSPAGAEGLKRYGWQFMSGGYTAVWAKANTRADLFDSMAKKEVYGTTGTRLKLRVFGGWDFKAADLKGDYVKAGYSRGVPMGGDLAAGKHKGAPSFIITATKDPLGANLDRVQVVKGWIDAKGVTHEQVFNAAWSSPDKRKLGKDGKIPAAGDTVDIKTATWKDTIGAPQLATVWKDPHFNAHEHAFYYVRVLEIPTPRWPAYDALRFGAKIPDGAWLKAQQRGYSSPIWYDPQG